MTALRYEDPFPFPFPVCTGSDIRLALGPAWLEVGTAFARFEDLKRDLRDLTLFNILT